MGRLSAKIKNLLSRFSSGFLLVIFMIIGITQFVFYNQDMQSHMREKSEIEQMEKEVAWSLIASTFDTVQRAADEKADRTALSIVNNIRAAYPDLSVLKVQLDKGKLQDTQLPHIIYDNLYGQQMFGISNGNNDSFVLLRDGYILDADVNRFGQTWHSFSDEKYISAKSLYDLMEAGSRINDGSMIYSYPCDTAEAPLNIVTSRINKQELMDIFMEKGLDGLKDYTFFGKAYITDTGDIFDTPDVSRESRKNSNHKMIVIQKFNMYDIMNYHHGKDLELNHMTFKSIRDNIERTAIFRNIGYLGLFGLDIVAMLIIVFTAIGKKEDYS